MSQQAPEPRVRRLVRPSFASAVCALALGASAALSAQQGPELPSHPEARQSFVPGPAEPAAEPASPAIPHPGRDGGPGTGGEPATVNLADLTVREVPPAAGRPLFHLQGEEAQADRGFDPAFAFSRTTEAIDSTRPEVASTLTSSGEVRTNFAGLSSTGWIPPDIVMAVGPSHVVQAVNSGFAIFSKNGSAQQGYTTFDSFFAPVKPAGWSGFLFDPRVLYSPEHGKFVMLALGLDQTNLGSYLYVAVSQTTNPTGVWWVWRINSNFAGLTGDAWLDYAGLAADSWGIYATGNYYFWAGGFKYSTIISLNPAMFSGGSSNGWQFVNLQWPSASVAFGLQPALPLSIAGGAETYFLNSFFSFGNQLLLWTLTGDRTSSPTLVRSTVGTTSYDSILQNVDQPGSATHLDGGDARIMNAYYSQRRVYGTLTSDTNANTTSSGAFVAKINVDTKLTEWNVTVDGGPGWYYFYPALAIGDAVSTTPSVSLFLSWTHPASNRFASSAVKTYLRPPLHQAGPFPSLALGQAAYVSLDGNNRNRWGDYQGAAFDFTNGTVWGSVEHAGTGNSWRTQVAELSAALFADGFETGNTNLWQ